VTPFNGRPEGFSDATLGLLDQGMTRLWLQQVAIEAAKSANKSAKQAEAIRAMPPAAAKKKAATLSRSR
jgi:hypothetical protein